MHKLGSQNPLDTAVQATTAVVAQPHQCPPTVLKVESVRKVIIAHLVPTSQSCVILAATVPALVSATLLDSVFQATIALVEPESPILGIAILQVNDSEERLTVAVATLGSLAVAYL